MSKTEKMEVWFNPEDPVGYAGIEKLAKRTKQDKKTTENWLKNQLAYSLNKPMRRRFPTRKYKTGGPNELWQADLLEMIPYSKINDGYKYILTCIDVFSRFARVVPLKSKSMKEVSEAVFELIKSDKPINFQTDLGKEFYNKEVKQVLDKNNINHYSVFSQYKAALVERFNRTLRGRLNKYFTKQGNKKWIDVLDKIVNAYNHSEHRGINGLRPVDITSSNSFDLWLQRNKRKSRKKPRYKIGDYVRISKISTTPFIKNFDQNWSDEVFQISKINTKQNPIMYTIKDEENNDIQGKFYHEELQVLPQKPDIYRIESILETKGKGKNKKLLVKWVGYKNPEWIIESNLV